MVKLGERLYFSTTFSDKFLDTKTWDPLLLDEQFVLIPQPGQLVEKNFLPYT